MIKENLHIVKEAIPCNVTLVAVSKTKPVSDLQEAYNAGQPVPTDEEVLSSAMLGYGMAGSVPPENTRSAEADADIF